MARRVKVKVLESGRNWIANHPKVREMLMEHGENVEAAAQRDPNPDYVDSIRLTEHQSTGRKPRPSVRVGAHPAFGMAVEAKRGTLQRALGEA